MKRLLIIAMACLAFGACKNKEAGHEHEMHAGEHIYACPMHPEVTGKEGDKCPKCGMPLEHNDAAAKSKDTYKMSFTSNPAAIEAGKQVTLSLKPAIVGRETEDVPLDIEHEKLIHLIMVSDDLGWFDHQHPELTDQGTYELPYTFKNGGNYILFADYKPTGGGHELEQINLSVKGNQLPPKTFPKPQLASGSGEYEVKLEPGTGKFESGSLQHIKATVTKAGKALDAGSLENYLGAKAHVVMVSFEDKNYLHVHPDVADGAFDLHTTFDKPGMYRAWLQFRDEGKIHTTDFVIKVERGSAASGADAHHEHDHGEKGHTH